jgi:hypothetical protein
MTLHKSIFPNGEHILCCVCPVSDCGYTMISIVTDLVNDGMSTDTLDAHMVEDLGAEHPNHAIHSASDVGE